MGTTASAVMQSPLSIYGPGHTDIFGGGLEPTQTFEESVHEFERDCERRRLRCAHRYGLAVRRFAAFQEANGRPLDPSEITRDDVDAFRIEVEASTSVRNARHSLSIVNAWLYWAGNANACLRGVRWPAERTRPGRWLTIDEKKAVEAADQPYRWIAHCGFRLGLRHDEWLRLKVADIGAQYVTIRDGKGGGVAWIPSLTSTPAEFDAVMRWREELLAAHPVIPADDSILLVKFGRRLQRPSPRWADQQVEAMSAASAARGGPAFTSHDMRRTCARHLYDAGAPLNAIREFLRHKKLETTIEYLGVNLEATAVVVRQIEAAEARLHPEVDWRVL